MLAMSDDVTLYALCSQKFDKKNTTIQFISCAITIGKFCRVDPRKESWKCKICSKDTELIKAKSRSNTHDTKHNAQQYTLAGLEKMIAI